MRAWHVVVVTVVVDVVAVVVVVVAVAVVAVVVVAVIVIVPAFGGPRHRPLRCAEAASAAPAAVSRMHGAHAGPNRPGIYRRFRMFAFEICLLSCPFAA